MEVLPTGPVTNLKCYYLLYLIVFPLQLFWYLLLLQVYAKLIQRDKCNFCKLCTIETKMDITGNAG